MRRYEQYKDSGVEWIGEIPEGWNVSSIGRYTNLGRGRVISHLEIQENPGDYPVYSSQTENDGVMGFINTYDFEGEYVTWTTDGANAGTVSYRAGKFNCTNVCGTIQPRDNEQLDLKYLPYLLNLGTKFSVRLDINPKLMNNMMAKIPLVLPPKTEQTAIASFLDRKTAEIDQLIANKEKLIALYEEEKTAIISRAVTRGLDPAVKTRPSGVDWLGDIPEHWEVKRLKYLASLITARAADSSAKIGLENIESKTGKYIETDSEFEGEGISFQTDDILYGKLRPYLAKVWIAEFAGSSIGDVFVLRVTSNYLSRFLKYILLSSPFTEIANSSTFGSKMPRVSWEFMSDLSFGVPPLPEQTAIVTHIETECARLDTIIDKFKKQIELFKEYRTTLISEVVTGKIDVRGEVGV